MAVPFVSAGTEYIFEREPKRGLLVQSIYKPGPCFFKENQKGDAYSVLVYPGVFTRWILGLWFSLKVHGLQIGAPNILPRFGGPTAGRPGGSVGNLETF